MADYFLIGLSNLIFYFLFLAKEIFNREKSLHFIVNEWDPWIKKMIDYLSFIEGKGGMKDFCWISKFHAAIDILSW